jgi:general secretion pathway protein D
MLTADVSAQIQMPSDSGPPSVTPTATPQAMPQPTLASAQQLLAGVRTALIKKDYHTAVQSYRRVTAMSGNLPQIADEVGKLRAQLLAIGIDGALLSLPPTPPAQPLAGVVNPKPLGGRLPVGVNSASRKQEALRLVAIGRASLDRGDITTAVAIARKAEALNVPEKDFAPGEPRVWQLLLDAESAARRSGVSLASGTEPLANPGTTSGPAVNPVQAALAMTGADDTGNVAQAPFNTQPQNSGTSPANTNVKPVQAIAPIAGQQTGQPNHAQKSLAEGLDALGRGDTAVARAKFREAWKHESDLTLAERNQLKDKLTLLQPKRITQQASTPPEEMTAIQRAELAEQDRTRRLFREVTAELAKAEQIKETAPLDALDELERLRRRVDGSELSDQGKRSMAMMVDRAIGDQKQFIEANRAKIDLELQNDAVRAEMATEQAKNLVIDEEVSALVRSFNDLIKDRRYQEAEIIAKQVQELKPDDPIAVSMFHTSRMGTRLMIDQDVRDKKELAFLDTMIDVDRSAVAIDPQMPLTMPDARDWEALSRLRLQDANNGESRLSQAEQDIQRKLITEVSIKYANRPLGEVIDELSAVTGVPMVLDMRALNAVRVTTDTPVTLQLPSSIKLKSALNLILNSLELTYVIENDVLSITSLEAKRSKVYPRTYRVTDLVTPIPNFSTSYEDGLAGALRAAYQMTNPQANVQVMPVSMTDLGNGMAGAAAGMNSNVLGQYNPMGSQGGFGVNNPPMGGGAAGGGSFADFQSLMDLIQTTIVPDTWEALGGPSSMSPYPQNLSLVISTTSDVHDQIADLLESLRRLQNLQITIEVRFITLSDTFAEQIGVDFQVQFDDRAQTLPTDSGGPSVVIGWDGVNGVATPDLDITLNNQSFGLAPPFGAETVSNASTIGFAILSDIEAFFFLQAAQADNRNNVMQAPKVTLFDGQLATISDQTQVPFVTSITPVVGDFAVAQQPVIVVLNEGTQLNVQGIVSNDKRFVRLTLVPFFSQIGKVDTFTYEGRRTTQSSSRQEADTNNDGTINESDEQETEDVIEGSTVQLPQFAFTTVSTTVSVPDGGTILLGGIKRLREGRSERGIPVLGKIPYLSRLFRNVSTGREAQSLMLMVTPRIIIQEEEEERQTGFNPDQQ